MSTVAVRIFRVVNIDFLLSVKTTIIHLSNDRNKSPLYFETSLKRLTCEQNLSQTEVFRQTDVVWQGQK